MPKDQLQPELGSDGAAMLRPGANSVQHGVQRGHFTLFSFGGEELEGVQDRQARRVTCSESPDLMVSRAFGTGRGHAS